jgi:hypothetical protein
VVDGVLSGVEHDFRRNAGHVPDQLQAVRMRGLVERQVRGAILDRAYLEEVELEHRERRHGAARFLR